MQKRTGVDIFVGTFLFGLTMIAVAVMMALALGTMIGTVHASDLRSIKDAPETTVIQTEEQSWTGVWAAALAGYSMSKTDLSLDIWYDHGDNEREAHNLGKLDGFGGEGFDATLQIGADRQVGKMLFGGWVEYAFGGTESSASVLDNAAGLKVEQNDSYGACGRAGVVNGDTLVYGAGCYIWTSFDADLHIGDEHLSRSFDFSGPAAELGMEHRFGPNVRGKLSARYTWLDKETVFSVGDEEYGGRLTAEPGVLAIKAGIVITTDFLK